MRILADENVPGVAVEAMRREGHDVTWVRIDAPGSTDEAVLTRAQSEDRILITFDKDFGEWVFRKGAAVSPGIILIRIATQHSGHASAVVIAALRTRSDWERHFSVIEEGRIRMTPMLG